MEEERNKSTFEKLNAINVNDKVKTKMGLKYLSWAYAWGELKKLYPDATMTIYKRYQSLTRTITKTDPTTGQQDTTTITSEEQIPYHTDGRTCWVEVGVEIKGVEYIEQYPIMDLHNHSILLSSVTSVDVNKAIQRAFVKACARHGLGLYIYAGEDLPEDEQSQAIDSNDFATVQKDVIALVTRLSSTTAAAEMSRYIKEMFSVRLSLTTEKDLDKLIAARTYLRELEAKLGGNH